MKKTIRNISIILILMLHAVLFGQKETPQLFEPTLIKADIDTLIFKLMDVHPTFLDYYKSNNLKSKIDSIKNSITSPMSSLDFFRIMQPIVTIDGHTTLRHTGGICPNEDSPLFPFKVIIFKNSLYIKENLSKNEALVKGSIIEKINGGSSKKIIRNLIRYIPGEKESYKIKKLEKDFHIYMALVYGSFSDFEITVNKSELKLKGAKCDAFHEVSKPKFELRFYDDDIAYIYKRMFMPPKDFLHFMDSAFTAISERHINYLIIDNLQGGGLTDLADSLISYFADKPYRLLEKKATKISPFTKEFIESKKEEGHIQGGYFIQEYPKHSSALKNRFPGLTYILTGPLSYSTATSFPAAARCFQNTFIVGEETGQPLLSNGDQNQFMLPGTKMSCITALSKVYMPGHNNDEINGVFPDFNVTPTLEDLLNDREYTLEYTLKLIRKNKIKEDKNVLDTKDAYFGLTPPGLIPKVFAPGIGSDSTWAEHCQVAISPNGDEIYWSAWTADYKTEDGAKNTEQIFFSKFETGMWTKPKLAEFTEGNPHGLNGGPSFSPDGNKLFFYQVKSPWVSSPKRCYYVEKKNGKLGNQLIDVGQPYSSESHNDTPVFTQKGHAYKNARGTILQFSYKNEKFTLLDTIVIHKDFRPAWNIYVSPMEDYVIFAAKHEGGVGDIDLYISFKTEEDEWGTPVNMGPEINTELRERFPMVSPDGK